MKLLFLWKKSFNLSESESSSRDNDGVSGQLSKIFQMIYNIVWGLELKQRTGLKFQLYNQN